MNSQLVSISDEQFTNILNRLRKHPESKYIENRISKFFKDTLITGRQKWIYYAIAINFYKHEILVETLDGSREWRPVVNFVYAEDSIIGKLKVNPVLFNTLSFEQIKFIKNNPGIYRSCYIKKNLCTLTKECFENNIKRIEKEIIKFRKENKYI